MEIPALRSDLRQASGTDPLQTLGTRAKLALSASKEIRDGKGKREPSDEAGEAVR